MFFRNKLRYFTLLLTSSIPWKCVTPPRVWTSSRTKAKMPTWVYSGNHICIIQNWELVCDLISLRAGPPTQEGGGERRAAQSQERWPDVQEKKCGCGPRRGHFSSPREKPELSGEPLNAPFVCSLLKAAELAPCDFTQEEKQSKKHHKSPVSNWILFKWFAYPINLPLYLPNSLIPCRSSSSGRLKRLLQEWTVGILSPCSRLHRPHGNESIKEMFKGFCKG